jgi:uncharacterized protein (TIGR02145 family)
MQKFLMLFLLTSSLLSCQNGETEQSPKKTMEVEVNKLEAFTDQRDGQSYPAIQIGKQIWLANNLRFKTDSSWYYHGEKVEFSVAGRLYTWNQAKKACPKGWHLPSQEEWMTLVSNFSNTENLENEGNQDIFQALKKGGSSHLNLYLSGFYNSAIEKFIGFGRHGSYWTSSKFGLEAATCALITVNDFEEGYFMFTPGSQDAGHACRCIKD